MNIGWIDKHGIITTNQNRQAKLFIGLNIKYTYPNKTTT